MTTIDQGFFISFEGIEGVGKSTQIEMVTQYLTEKGLPIVCTKEPGGTVIGETLRRLILDPEYKFHSYYTDVLLFYADRLEHVESVILPALKSGKIVLCDRYVDSTTAYQIGGKGISKSLIDKLNELVPVMPNLTLLFDLDPQEGLSRARKRNKLDRFELESLQFHQKIRDAYLKIAEENPERVVAIDVQHLSPAQVFRKTMHHIEGALQTKTTI